MLLLFSFFCEVNVLFPFLKGLYVKIFATTIKDLSERIFIIVCPSFPQLHNDFGCFIKRNTSKRLNLFFSEKQKLRVMDMS